MIPYKAGPLVTAAGLAGLLYSEWAGSYPGVWIFKPLASAGFLLTASPALAPSSKPHSHTPSSPSSSKKSSESKNPFSTPAAPSPRGVFNRSVFGSLVFCALGDVLLIPSRHSNAFFKAGLVAFLLGHIGFGASFIQGDLDPKTTLLAGAGQTIFAGIVWRWLSPSIPDDDRFPVALYTVVLAAMGALAIGGASSWKGKKKWTQIAGALLFELSDLCVARQQFVVDSYWNPAIGLPLYYLSTTLLATLVWPW
ncbi:hypothetical protein CspeluHIS016_0301170 [Cutaneotrichosporon spelunceum]|uniref:YhhN-like protein n=1 Tax=Cutaneotrichosporon spelunceum TaxID=1672016 RepID=A0AAD3TTK1_9TREE|nr:hypothetical protein CspeluHIS016_0301170 [Cutaneotrichosporon spelunceum]